MWTIHPNMNWEELHERFAWLRALEDIPQDPIFHAEGDVATHTRMVLEALQTLPEFQVLAAQQQQILLAAALLHDVEKASTTIQEADGRISSRGHARKGEYTARQLLYRILPAPFEVKEQVAKLVRYHGLPLWVFEKPDPQKAILQASLEVDLSLLVLLAKADILGRICDDQEELLYKIELFQAFAEEQKCWGKARAFPSGLGRYRYFHTAEAPVDYVPYEGDCFEVVVLSALPGTGKDHYLQQYCVDWPVVSLDAVRRQHKIAPTDKRGNGRVIQSVKELARTYLRRRASFVWNATNISRNMRAGLIDLFQSYGAHTRLVYLEVPYQQLLRQNQQREFPVPQQVLERMINKLEVPALWEAPAVEWQVY